jgi:hypothetical protein
MINGFDHDSFKLALVILIAFPARLLKAQSREFKFRSNNNA